MRLRIVTLLCCASELALAQHEGHSAPPSSGARFDFQVTGLYVDQGTFRGARRFTVADWEHLTSPTLLWGKLRFRAMTSFSALVDRNGIPALLQTGGTDRHAYIHDRQHPADLVMEAAAELREPVGKYGTAFVYLAPIGSPALGPVAWLHRPSAAGHPSAPLGHHWQDATHASYGVASAGVVWRGLVAEASAFNARESDFKSPWPDFSHARLDSYAGRVGFDARSVAVRAWWGYLKNHDPIAPAMQMHRYGGSASLEVGGVAGGQWSSLAVWSMNVHHHDGTSHALLHGDPNASPHVRSSSMLLESSLGVGTQHAVFARAERVMKNGEELGFLGGDLTHAYEIRSVAAGGRRDFARARGMVLAAGARGALTLLPESLRNAYGTRTPKGFDVFAQVRPR